MFCQIGAVTSYICFFPSHYKDPYKIHKPISIICIVKWVLNVAHMYMDTAVIENNPDSHPNRTQQPTPVSYLRYIGASRGVLIPLVAINPRFYGFQGRQDLQKKTPTMTLPFQNGSQIPWVSN